MSLIDRRIDEVAEILPQQVGIKYWLMSAGDWLMRAQRWEDRAKEVEDENERQCLLNYAMNCRVNANKCVNTAINNPDC